MLNAFLDPLYESIIDMTQNNVSLIVIAILFIIVILLIGASFFPFLRKSLVRVRFLEKDESPKSLLLWVIGIVFLVKLVQAFLFQPFIVDGGSMLPTFHTKEFLIVDKLSYHFHEARRGDVVVFKLYEQNGTQYAGKYLIKRVIGLPGERVVVRGGVTTIYNKENENGFIVPETFVTHTDIEKEVDMTLTENQYFVMGDNRSESYDSRSWGPLQAEQVRGKVFLRILPISVASLFPGEYSYSK